MDATQLTRAEGAEQLAGQIRQEVTAASSSALSEAVAVARREAWQLPVLRRGRAGRRLPGSWEGVHLRLQAALWELAACADVPVTAGSSVDAVARLLVGHGAIIPPAGDGVRALAAVAQAQCAGRQHVGDMDVDEGARLAERLSGYLALRARFG